MSPNIDVLEELAKFLSGVADSNLVVAADGRGDDNEEIVFQRLTLAKPVSRWFLDNASSIINQSVERTLREYEPGYKPDDDELCYIPLRDAAMAKVAVDSFAALDQVELFRESDEIIDNLRFYATVVQHKSRQAVFFRTFSPRNELTRSGYTPLAFSGDNYNELKQKVFLFDDQADCFAFGDYLFIQNVTQFQRIFGYFEELTKSADLTIGSITSRIPIDGLENFEKMCKSNQLMLAKLAQIARKPYLKSLAMSDIIRTINEFNIPVEVRSGKLVFDSSPKKRWLILKLLDDDHLGSSMTKTKYLSNSKVAI
jgi:hypothetical protein